MRSNGKSGKGEDLEPTLKHHQGGVGIDGHAAHGGDVAPPNSDQAGRRQSPESGPIDKH